MRFAGAAGQKGGYDVDYELPKPVKPKLRDPGRSPAPPTQLRWKILSLGYFDQQSKKYQIVQNANPVTPVVSGSEISYPQVFTGVDVKYTCQNVRLKEELVLSQSGRNSLPDPMQYGISRSNAYLPALPRPLGGPGMMAVEFALTPASIKVFARRQTGNAPVKQGNVFAFEGDDPIDFDDADSTLHFFFPRDYAWAVADSVTNFAGRGSVTRVFYSQAGKDYLLVGMPYNWLQTSPAGELVIDPTVTVTTVPHDAYITSGYPTTNNNNAALWIGNHYPGICRALVQFNLSSIPANAEVLSAQMKLYFASTSSGPVSRTIQCHQVLRSWSESTCTWNSPWTTPGLGINGADAKSTPEDTQIWYNETSTWKSYNLSALVKKWITTSPPTSNYGVVLWATNEGTTGEAKIVNSSENGSNTPKLEVIYSQLPRTVYFLKDHLGSIRASVQDTSTALVVGYDDYDPWGYIMPGRSMIAGGWGSQAGIVKNKFTGKEWDDEFGLNWNYFGARYYDPQIGRFFTIDPKPSENPWIGPYVYAANNPLFFIDPDGRKNLPALYYALSNLQGYKYGVGLKYEYIGGQTVSYVAVEWQDRSIVFLSRNRLVCNEYAYLSYQFGSAIASFPVQYQDQVKWFQEKGYWIDNPDTPGEPGDLIYTGTPGTRNERHVMMIVDVGKSDEGTPLYTLTDARTRNTSGIRTVQYDPKKAKGNLKFVGIGSLPDDYSETEIMPGFKEWANSMHTVWQDKDGNFHLR